MYLAGTLSVHVGDVRMRTLMDDARTARIEDKIQKNSEVAFVSL